MGRCYMFPHSRGTDLGLIWDYCTLLGARSYYPRLYSPTIAQFMWYRDSTIRGLSATFGRYPGHEALTSVVKYEEQVDSDPDAQSPTPISKFTLLVASSYRSHTVLTDV